MRWLRLVLPLAATSAALVARRHLLVRRVAPELRHGGLYVPMSLRFRHDLRLLRFLMSHASEPVPGVGVTRRTTRPGPDGHVPDVEVHEPADRTASGVLLWMHGGGLVAGTAAGERATCSRLAAELGCVVVAVDYRLAPEHPFPAAIEDCHAVLGWIAERADELGIDPGRIAVGGASAGGGLAASLAQQALDRGEVAVAFQLLAYPMLDDRTPLRAVSRGRFLVWTPVSNRFGWTSYLGSAPSHAAAEPYAAAARRDDLSGLPPAWIGVGTLDLFHDEATGYAERLVAAGVPCDLHVVPGFHHAADAAPDAPVAAEFRARMADAVRPCLTGSVRG